MRIFCASDIHGHYKLLHKLLLKAGFDFQRDRLYLLGDYVGRGPDNLDTLWYVYNMVQMGCAVALKGNHEDYLVKYMEEWSKDPELLPRRKKLMILNGDYTAVQELERCDAKELLLDFIKNMPLWVELEDYILVHAGISPACHPQDCDPDVLLWSRENFIESPTGLKKKVVYGHTPTDYGQVSFRADKIGIDCGISWGGNLALLELVEEKVWYLR